MKFTVVTPCLNPGSLLAETVATVLGQAAVQAGRVELEYLIIDGGSTDGTVDWLASLDSPQVRWVSEPDGGMYDAVAKGLSQAGGDVHAYLNAGDLYHPRAFDVVADVIPQTDGWLTGMQVAYNEPGTVVHAWLPFPFRRQWFSHRVYDGVTMDHLQQESTFWTSRLTGAVDLGRLRSFKMAGDAFLWATFAKHADLHVAGAHLGGFRVHPGHLSDDMDAYRAEHYSFTAPLPRALRPLLRFDVLMDRYATDEQKQTHGRGLVWLWRDGGWTNAPTYPPRRRLRLARAVKRRVPRTLREPVDRQEVAPVGRQVQRPA